MANLSVSKTDHGGSNPSAPARSTEAVLVALAFRNGRKEEGARQQHNAWQMN
jgi:hypothetical protein